MNEQDNHTPPQITDPNCKDRRSAPYFALAFCMVGIACTLIDRSFLPVSVTMIVSGILCSAILMGARPYTVLTPEGILVKFLFRQKFYRWQEIPQVGIPCSDGHPPVEYKFPLAVVCPNGFPRRLGTDKFFLDRNLFRAVILPNRPEIRSFICEHYGPLDFDDTQKLNDWQKRYYGFDKS